MVVELLSPRKGEIFLVLISVKRLSRPLGHRAAGRITSLKNVNGPIGNRSSELPDCCAVPQLNAPPRASVCHAGRP